MSINTPPNPGGNNRPKSNTETAAETAAIKAETELLKEKNKLEDEREKLEAREFKKAANIKAEQDRIATQEAKEADDIKKEKEKLEKEKKDKEEAAESARQIAMNKRISLSSYAALKASGPDLHTDTSHKYLKKGWFGQAMDVAESKFQRLREATFGSITTPKETYQHRISRDHSMVGTYEARFKDIKNSYTQLLEQMTGKKYSEIASMDDDKLSEAIAAQKINLQNLDPKLEKALSKNQNASALITKINYVNKVLNDINAPGTPIEIPVVDSQGNQELDDEGNPKIDKVETPGLMARVGTKNYKPGTKQDAKRESHDLYKLLDICENELLNLVNFEKSQVVASLAPAALALVRTNLFRDEPEPTTEAQEALPLTPEQELLKNLFQNKGDFKITNLGINGIGEIKFLLISTENGTGTDQIIFDHNTLNYSQKVILSGLKAHLANSKNSIEFKNNNFYSNGQILDLASNSKSGFEISPTIKAKNQPGNPEQIESIKETIEKGDFDYLVDKYFSEFTPSILKGIQSGKNDDVLFDIQILHREDNGTEVFKHLPIYLTESDQADHSMFNKLRIIHQSIPNAKISFANGMVDLEYSEPTEAVATPDPLVTPSQPLSSTSSVALTNNKVYNPELNTINNEVLSTGNEDTTNVALNIKNMEVKGYNDLVIKYFADLQPFVFKNVELLTGSNDLQNDFSVQISKVNEQGQTITQNILIPKESSTPKGFDLFEKLSIGFAKNKDDFTPNYFYGAADNKMIFERDKFTEESKKKINNLPEKKIEKSTLTQELITLEKQEINIQKSIIDKYFKDFDEFEIQGLAANQPLDSIVFIGNGSNKKTETNGANISINIDELVQNNEEYEFIGKIEKHLNDDKNNIVKMENGEFQFININSNVQEQLPSNKDVDNKISEKYSIFKSTQDLLTQIFIDYPDYEITNINNSKNRIKLKRKNDVSTGPVDRNIEFDDVTFKKLINFIDFPKLQYINSTILKNNSDTINSANFSNAIKYYEDNDFAAKLEQNFNNNSNVTKLFKNVFLDNNSTIISDRYFSFELVNANTLIVNIDNNTSLFPQSSNNKEVDLSDLDSDTMELIKTSIDKNLMFKTDNSNLVYLANKNYITLNFNQGDKTSNYKTKPGGDVKTGTSSIFNPIFNLNSNN